MQQDYNTDRIRYPRRGNLITYRTNMRDINRRMQGSYEEEGDPVNELSRSIDADSDDEEDLIMESVEAKEGQEEEEEEEGDEDVFQFESNNDKKVYNYSSSLPSLVSDHDTEFSDSDDSLDDEELNYTQHYEWLYEAPAKKEQQLKYETKLSSLLQDEKSYSNAPARNYQLWLSTL